MCEVFPDHNALVGYINGIFFKIPHSAVPDMPYTLARVECISFFGNTSVIMERKKKIEIKQRCVNATHGNLFSLFSRNQCQMS